VKSSRENSCQNVFAILPARFSATRLTGKLLLPLAGKALIIHTLERAKAARNVSRVFVATDDERIRQTVEAAGGAAVVMTSPAHKSGSDRAAEVAADLPENSIIVNVQADEPLISPRTIEQAVDALLLAPDDCADVATVSEPFDDWWEVLNPNAVKVTVDKSSFAVYFSRAPIPFPRDAAQRHGDLGKALQREPELLATFRRHVGLYVYRREFLLKFTALPPSALEEIESLEQLRALENGAKIKVIATEEKSIGVDTAADFERVRQILENL
jgi:3-deoxy-manno-octulosonate cytidylyltransferase (CMP-KDO synthetase)